MAQLIQLYDGDKQCEALVDELLRAIYARGMTLPTVLGALRIVEHSIIQDALE